MISVTLQKYYIQLRQAGHWLEGADNTWKQEYRYFQGEIILRLDFSGFL